MNSSVLGALNVVVGWLYFAAWTVSFYPQVHYNWSRKSVVGLNFDYLCYNLTGFLGYSFFNVGMYWVASVQGQYFALHPRGINPVQLNDVVFSMHGVLITLLTIAQCFIYDRGGQRVSLVACVLCGGAWLVSSVAVIATLSNVITLLTCLYFFAYIKLGTTLIKYVPQAYMNYRRKSTEGWSIGNVLLDFTGGVLSLAQMMLLNYISGDWSSIFGDPAKFGVSVFSLLFDVLFMVQHYGLYRDVSEFT